MFRRIRGFAAVLVASAVLLSGAAPALAFTDEGLAASERHTPVLVDALLLRPMGLLLIGAGAVTFAMVAPFVAITRPTNTAVFLDANFCTFNFPSCFASWIQKGVGYRCAKHPAGRYGNGTCPLFEPLRETAIGGGQARLRLVLPGCMRPGKTLLALLKKDGGG